MWQEIEKTGCVFLEHNSEIKRFRPSTNRQSKPRVLFQVLSTKYSKGEHDIIIIVLFLVSDSGVSLSKEPRDR